MTTHQTWRYGEKIHMAIDFFANFLKSILLNFSFFLISFKNKRKYNFKKKRWKPICSGGRGLNSLLVIHKHAKEEIIYQCEGGDVKSWDINGLGRYIWVGSRLSGPSKLLKSIAIFACNRCSILYSVDCGQLIQSWAHSSIFQGAMKILGLKCTISNLIGSGIFVYRFHDIY